MAGVNIADKVADWIVLFVIQLRQASLERALWVCVAMKRAFRSDEEIVSAGAEAGESRLVERLETGYADLGAVEGSPEETLTILTSAAQTTTEFRFG